MRQSRELLMKVRQHCQVMRIAADFAKTDEAEHGGAGEVRLPNGGRVIALPARPETIRGYTGDVVLDEFAMHADDRAIWAAIFPTILRSDGELDIASTPKGKSNLFYQLAQNESFAHKTVTLPEAIEQGLDIDMEALRRAMGDEELFRQEFLCDFLDESLAFLPYSLIAACEDDGVDKDADWAGLAASRGDVYVGVDVARKRDLTVIWLWGEKRGRKTEDRRQETGDRRQETGDRRQKAGERQDSGLRMVIGKQLQCGGGQ